MIEINLIPKRKKKSYFLLYSLMFIFIIAIFCSTVLFIQIHSEKERAQTYEKQLQQIQALIEIENSKLTDSEKTSSADILNETINWMNKERIDSVPLLGHLISLLPERGFFESFSYSLNGDMQLSVQFDSSREAAFYLNKLVKSQWVKSAKIHSITAKEEETEEEQQIGDAKILPRYSAYYQLSINKKYIKDLQAEGGNE
ncbi:PilN domain-containing protein [Lederbergia panacisoli]|uniref:PilN domain-containing protein n=1 Tax=Lederbergia panacisoli TaxID=1255251 RepID=UPI00214AE12C|nr:hypothetical protein [Lederbergia panacisoli]MCR2820546.1 hypothetical protein [Lederbergia panacisoli]